jgi:hypothetical protein
MRPSSLKTELVDELAAIVARVGEARETAFRARKRHNIARQRELVDEVWRLERRGGALLLAGVPAPELSRRRADRWRGRAQLSEQEFELRLRRATPAEGGRGASPPPVRMKVDSWTPDENGIPTRTIEAVDPAK